MELNPTLITPALQIVLMVGLGWWASHRKRRDRVDAKDRALQKAELDIRFGDLKSDLTAEIRKSSDAIFSHLGKHYVTNKECNVLHEQVKGVPERLARLEAMNE